MNRPGNGKAARPVKLNRLLAASPEAKLQAGAASTEITGLAYDSRAVQPGFLFLALRGEKTNGALFAEDAIRRGAVAVLHDQDLRLPRGVAAIQAPDARLALADLAAEFYAHPSRQLRVLGVTGTNGKTTTTFMIRDILQAAGQSCGLLGTVQYEYGGRRLAAGRTTPEALDLQRMLAEALHAGCQAMAMEVSSQGLAAERLRGVRFAAAVFTNLSVDHLDFHHTMEAYFLAKKRLFDTIATQGGAPAILNADDPHGRQLAADPALAGHVVTFGGDPAAQVRAVDIQLTETSSTFRVITPWGEAAIATGFAGRFNVYNALAAIATCGTLGVPLPVMAATLAAMPAVPGRMERIADPRGRHIFVDYAHTEDALRNVLQTLRENAPGHLLCVFGCGGNRDRGKRPRMGAAVAEYADLAIVTSDNPRHEEPQGIIDDILAGMDLAKPHLVEPDRAAAIAAALRAARAGDTILIAGKGHEPYQEIAGRMAHFDDRETVRALLATIPPAT